MPAHAWMRRARVPRFLSPIALLAVAALLPGALQPPPAHASATVDGLVAVDVPAMGWQDIAYGNGRYVAVAISGTGRSVTSTDGVTWSAAGLPDERWEHVSFCGGRFFATGANNANTAVLHYTSTDGTSWTQSVGAPSLWSVACDGSRFVGVSGGSGDRGFSSNDGLTWTAGTITPITWANQLWNDVVFAAGRFVAVSYFPLANQFHSARVMTSVGGSAWTVATVPDGSRTWDGIAYGNGTFVAVSRAPAGFANPPGGTLPVMTSTDGLNWTLRSSADDSVQWTEVRFEDGRFVAAGEGGGSDPTRRIMTSADGITWTLEPAAPASLRWQAIALAPGQFVGIAASGSSRQIYVSGGGNAQRAADPATWVTIDQALPAGANGACDDIPDAHVAYGTGLSGGWGRSWAAWAGPGGGAVCTRSLVNRGTGWVLASSR